MQCVQREKGGQVGKNLHEQPGTRVEGTRVGESELEKS